MQHAWRLLPTGFKHQHRYTCRTRPLPLASTQKESTYQTAKAKPRASWQPSPPTLAALVSHPPICYVVRRPPQGLHPKRITQLPDIGCPDAQEHGILGVQQQGAAVGLREVAPVGAAGNLGIREGRRQGTWHEACKSNR